MDTSAIHLAIPVFFLLIGVELVVARLVERDVYRLSDSVNDLSCGILQQVAEVFLKTALFAGYAALFAGHRLFEIPAAGAAWAWAACFLGVDFLYYWFHRFSHEVGAGWAAHVVHHQSEEYNLTVALRQGAFQPAVSWVFYLPLALVGFPPAMFLVVSSFNTLYQFWIHTRLIGRLGPLEWVLNTPSHHRVHHARNPKYIDRNHGGTLIVWDRLFGTFGEEREEPVYGVTKPLASWNPVWANLHQWSEMWEVARRAGRPLDKLRVLWKRPGWRPEELGGPVSPREVDRATLVKYDVPVSRGLAVYVLAHFVAVTAGAVALLYVSGRLGLLARSAGALAVVGSLASLGGLLDRRPWASGLEASRMLAAGLAFLLLPLPGPVAAAGVALATASAAWILQAQKGPAERASPRRPVCARIGVTQPAAMERPPGTRSEMVTVCAWCQKYMGSREPLHNPAVSHGICNECVERNPLDDAPVLVVSRDRVHAIPVLQSLLRGAPEIEIVVDRRAGSRRGGNGHARPLAYVVDRRAADRRRTPSFYLV